MQVKLGHGGTLDPAATGVLIVGVGSGTKELQGFLKCTKSYEAVVLFGAATDSHDGEGKVVKRAGYADVSEQKVKEALGKFRGEIMQRPPVFSALRVAGKRMYEYAREGKEIPELAERPVTVDECEMVEWMEGCFHGYHWPEVEAEKETSDAVEKVLHLEDKTSAPDAGQQTVTEELDGNLKRKRDVDVGETVRSASPPEKRTKADEEPTMSGAIPNGNDLEDQSTETKDNEKASAAASTAQSQTQSKPSSRPPCPAPAARIRMTVSSGFYVRSLCHDLGIAVGSLGFMAYLVRTRQGEFELGKNVLEYSDLAKGEDVWAPKVTDMLAEWEEKPGSDQRSSSPG